MTEYSGETIISVDLGTSSVRACLVNSTLKILHQSKQSITLSTDSHGKAIQDSREIMAIALDSINANLIWAKEHGFAPLAISFSNAVGSLVYLDEQYQPLGPALTYLDLRASQEADHLVETLGHSFFTSTATPVHASYWLPKLLWLSKNEPVFPNVHYFCTIKDLFVLRLTGQFVTDRSNATATGLFNVKENKWDDQLLEVAGINSAQLPETNSTTTILPISDNSGLLSDPETPLVIVLGATDGVLSSLGAGAFKPGQVTTMIGSSGACRIAADSPLVDEDILTAWSYPLDDKIWIRGGAMNSGGLVTQWLVETFSSPGTASRKAYSEFFQLADPIPAGANGLRFLPYIFGERSPIFDETARGVFFGINSSHHRGHFARAGIEGILMALYSIFEVINADQEEVEIRATGGYLQSPLMVQIQADLFGQPIRIPADYEGSSIGAAALAFKALGKIESFDEISAMLPIAEEIEPDLENHKIYLEVYQEFKSLYRALKPLFKEQN